MNTIVRTPEQIEVAEIIDRLEREYGLNKAGVARQLGVARGYVGMLAKGQRNPPLRTLQQMRELEEKMRRGRAQEAPALNDRAADKRARELDELHNRLALLERTDRAKFEVAKSLIETLAPSAVNYTTASAGGRLLKKGAASVRKPVPG